MAEQSKTPPTHVTDLSFTEGKVFEKVFVDGMALVEETASYLDGPGRKLSSSLPREASLTYAAWSMELTTRLMQAASWLVMQKAVRDGDMRSEDAMQSKYRISREDPALDASAAARPRSAGCVSSIWSSAQKTCSSGSVGSMRRFMAAA